MDAGVDVVASTELRGCGWEEGIIACEGGFRGTRTCDCRRPRLRLQLRPRLTKAAKGGGQLGNDATRCSTMCQSHDVLHREAAQKPGENMGELIDEGGA